MTMIRELKFHELPFLMDTNVIPCFYQRHVIYVSDSTDINKIFLHLIPWHISSCFRPWRQFLAHWGLGRWQRGLLEVAQWRRGVRHKSDYHRPIRTWPTRLQRPQPEKYSNTDGEVWNHQTTDLWMAKLDLIFFVCLQRSEGFIVVWNVVFAYKMNHKHDFVFILTINNLYKSLTTLQAQIYLSWESTIWMITWKHNYVYLKTMFLMVISLQRAQVFKSVSGFWTADNEFEIARNFHSYLLNLKSDIAYFSHILIKYTS